MWFIAGFYCVSEDLECGPDEKKNSLKYEYGGLHMVEVEFMLLYSTPSIAAQSVVSLGVPDRLQQIVSGAEQIPHCSATIYTYKMFFFSRIILAFHIYLLIIWVWIWYNLVYLIEWVI